MEVVEKIETLIKFSESGGKDMLILSGIGFAICCFFTLIKRIIENSSKTSIEIWIIGLLTCVIIAIIGIYKPTILDLFLPNEPKTHYETNVDKSKYELSVITNNNEKYLKFDNKGNNNIQLRNNDKKVNSDIFKIVAENDNEYLLEYEVVDKGFFTDTVSTERSSLTKK
jgi:hypothetical protein